MNNKKEHFEHEICFNLFIYFALTCTAPFQHIGAVQTNEKHVSTAHFSAHTFFFAEDKLIQLDNYKKITKMRNRIHFQ